MSGNRKETRKWGWPVWALATAAGVMFVSGNYWQAVLAAACAASCAWLAAPGNRARAYKCAAGVTGHVPAWFETRAATHGGAHSVKAPCRRGASVSSAEIMRSWLVLF